MTGQFPIQKSQKYTTFKLFLAYITKNTFTRQPFSFRNFFGASKFGPVIIKVSEAWFFKIWTTNDKPFHTDICLDL